MLYSKLSASILRIRLRKVQASRLAVVIYEDLSIHPLFSCLLEG